MLTVVSKKIPYSPKAFFFLAASIIALLTIPAIYAQPINLQTKEDLKTYGILRPLPDNSLVITLLGIQLLQNGSNVSNAEGDVLHLIQESEAYSEMVALGMQLYANQQLDAQEFTYPSPPAQLQLQPQHQPPQQPSFIPQPSDQPYMHSENQMATAGQLTLLQGQLNWLTEMFFSALHRIHTGLAKLIDSKQAVVFSIILANMQANPESTAQILTGDMSPVNNLLLHMLADITQLFPQQFGSLLSSMYQEPEYTQNTALVIAPPVTILPVLTMHHLVTQIVGVPVPVQVNVPVPVNVSPPVPTTTTLPQIIIDQIIRTEIETKVKIQVKTKIETEVKTLVKTKVKTETEQVTIEPTKSKPPKTVTILGPAPTPQKRSGRRKNRIKQRTLIKTVTEQIPATSPPAEISLTSVTEHEAVTTSLLIPEPTPALELSLTEAEGDKPAPDPVPDEMPNAGIFPSPASVQRTEPEGTGAPSEEAPRKTPTTNDQTVAIEEKPALQNRAIAAVITGVNACRDTANNGWHSLLKTARKWARRLTAGVGKWLTKNSAKIRGLWAKSQKQKHKHKHKPMKPSMSVVRSTDRRQFLKHSPVTIAYYKVIAGVALLAAIGSTALLVRFKLLTDPDNRAKRKQRLEGKLSTGSETAPHSNSAHTLAERLVAEFIDRGLDDHFFPAASVYQYSSDGSLKLQKKPAGKSSASFYYGVVGHTSGAEKRQLNTPLYNVSLNSSFKKTAKLLAERLDVDMAETAQEMALAEELDPISQVYLFCGIPVNEHSKPYHAACLQWIADQFRDSGTDWYQSQLHERYYLAQTNQLHLDPGQKYLGFVPEFLLEDKTLADKIRYEPRLLEIPVEDIVLYNRPVKKASNATKDIELPAQAPSGPFDLLAYDQGEWRPYRENLNSNQHIIEQVHTDTVYGIRQNNNQDIRQFFIFSGDEPVFTPDTQELQDKGRIATERDSWQRSHFLRHPRMQMHPHTTREILAESSSLPVPVPRRSRTEKRNYGVALSAYSFCIIAAFLWKIYSLLKNPDIQFSWRVPVAGSLMLPIIYGIYDQFLQGYYDTAGQPVAPAGKDLQARSQLLFRLLWGYANDESGSSEAANMLAVLMIDPAPLGLFQYQQSTENQNHKTIQDYQPLSRLYLEDQQEVFDFTYRECKKKFGRCHYANKEHVEYIRFHMAFCTTPSFRDCPDIWEDYGQKQEWLGLIQAMNWPENTTAYPDISLQPDSYLAYPSLIRKKSGWRLSFQTRDSHRVFNPAEDSETPTQICIRGEYTCTSSPANSGKYHVLECYQDNGYTCFNGFINGLVRLRPVTESEWSPVYWLHFINGRIIQPHWSRGKLWFDAHVKVYSE